VVKTKMKKEFNLSEKEMICCENMNVSLLRWKMKSKSKRYKK